MADGRDSMTQSPSRLAWLQSRIAEAHDRLAALPSSRREAFADWLDGEDAMRPPAPPTGRGPDPRTLRPGRDLAGGPVARLRLRGGSRQTSRFPESVSGLTH